MPTCRHCFGVFPRHQFIHGNGPRAQVCVRCGLDKGLVEKEEVSSLYNSEIANARFSHIARYWSPLVWIFAIWTAWILIIRSLEPWGLYSLVLLVIFTLIAPVWMFLNRVKYLAGLEKLTPEYETPKGH